MENLTSLNSSTKATQMLARSSFPMKSSSQKNILTNFYAITLTKEVTFITYAVAFEPAVADDETNLKRIIVDKLEETIYRTFGYNVFTGGNLFALKDHSELWQEKVAIFETDYTVMISKTEHFVNLQAKQSSLNQSAKRLIEELIRKILRSNPALEFYRDLFVKTNESCLIKSNNNSMEFYPGFATSVHVMNDQIYLNICTKNKILCRENVLDMMEREKSMSYNEKDYQERVGELLNRKLIKTTHTKSKYFIKQVAFGKSPYKELLDNKSETIAQYFLNKYEIKLNKDQCLLEVALKRNDKEVIVFLPPEICHLAGLTDDMRNDFELMKKLAQFTKLEPTQKLKSITEGIELLYSKDKKNDLECSFSSCHQMESLGINISNKSLELKGDYLAVPKIVSGNGTETVDQEKGMLKNQKIKVLDCLDLIATNIVVSARSKNAVEVLKKQIAECSKMLGVHFGDYDVHFINNINQKTVFNFFNKLDTHTKDVTIFVLPNKSDSLYNAFKECSLNTVGFASQCIRESTLFSGKKVKSAITKMLIQIVWKINGLPYEVKFPKEINKQNLMVVGVNSSFYKGKTAFGMVATVSKDFSQIYYNTALIEEKNHKTYFEIPLSAFIEESIADYFKVNKQLPGGVVIYRQGVSKEQVARLENENINVMRALSGEGGTKLSNLLKENPIPYYYILVNKHVNFKFFEKNGKIFNPTTGLIVSQLSDNFEFYMQPQDVNQGTANPIGYQVAFGNLVDMEQNIYTLTYYLCFMYFNWQGPIKIPAPLMMAEKLSYLCAKVTRNHNISKGIRNYATFV